MTTTELLDKRIQEINNELSYLNQLIAKKTALELELADIMASKIEYTELVKLKPVISPGVLEPVI